MVGAGAAVAFGLVLRIVMARSNWGVLESDEAVVGLMARSIARGDIPTFYWGQNYGGTAESFLVAAVAGAVGWSVAAIRIVAIGLTAVAAVLLWRVGRRMIGPVAGAAAALAFWVWPLPYVFWSIKLRGFYWATIVCGLVFVLCAQRLAEDPSRRRDAVVAGVAAGVGWWSAPQIVVYVLPAVAWLAWRHRPTLRPLLTFGVPAAVLGALPWLLVNLRNGLLSLHPPELAIGASGSYVDHLRTFATKGLPVALGVREGWTEAWPAYGKPLYLVALVLLAVGAVVQRRTILPLALVTFPLVHAASPLAHYVGEGRYLVYFAPFLALALAAAVRHRLVLPALVAGLAVLTLVPLSQFEGYAAAYSGGRRVPDDMTHLIADLDARGLHHVYADYWIGYRLTYESDERIIAGGPRNRDYTRRVAAADKIAYVFMDGADTLHSLRAELTRLAVPWQEHEVIGFRVVEPARTVTPEELWGASA